MPSPFPGMDPYLEEPGLWPDVHHELISVSRQMLNELLRPKYHVRLEERVYISDENDPARKLIIPDLRISEVAGNENHIFSPDSGNETGAVAVAEPVVVTTLLDEEIRDTYLEVIDTSLRQVVTVIEILSPANKLKGSHGREAYLKKRQEIMRSPSHLVEIDLLRSGETIITREILPRYDYLVHLSRVEKRPQAKAWPIRLHQRLPVIDIPLRSDDPDARLDLQAILNTAYDRAAYDLEVDYRKEPNPSLSAELAACASEWLRAKGLR